MLFLHVNGKKLKVRIYFITITYRLMDILGGLAIVGKILGNNEKESTNTNQNKRKKIIDPKPNGNNIFNDNSYDKSNKLMESLSRDRFSKSKSPEKTGIIPSFYNRMDTRKKKLEISENYGSDSEFSDDDMSMSDQGSIDSASMDINDPTLLMKRADRVVDNRKHERKFVKKMKDNNNFLGQFEDMRFNSQGEPSSANAVPNIGGRNAGRNRLEVERELASKGGYSNFALEDDMTYGIFDSSSLTHNNMMPHGKGTGSYNGSAAGENKMDLFKQRKLDTFSGSINNLEYRPNSERKPLFNPIMGITNPFGMPNLSDVFESRYAPSKERRNELPFQQVLVTPGLNVGYNHVGNTAVPYRALPKTVDELRTANNPKVSYKGVIIPGMKGQRGPVQGKVSKRRPMTFWETSPDDLIPGVGDYRAPAITGEIQKENMATQNRGTKEEYYTGGAKYYTDLPVPESKS
jgi:hypothetical protein